MEFQQAVGKYPSAAFPSPFVVAAYKQVRLTPQDFGRSRKRDFARLNLHLPACSKPRLQKPCGGQALRRRQGYF